MKDEVLIVAIAIQPSDVAKQICLYAMMCQYRLVWDFMLTVIGDKYKKLDNFFGKLDLNIFYELTSARQLGCNLERNNYFKNKTSAKKLLIENEYLDNMNSDHLNPVLISSLLENAIREKGFENNSMHNALFRNLEYLAYLSQIIKGSKKAFPVKYGSFFTISPK